MIGNDEYLIKYIINNNLFNKVFDIYKENINKNNMLYSSFRELLGIISN